MKAKHDTVYLDYRGTRIAIDKKIAPLMKEIWKCGARTTSSCEDIGGVCLVQFEDAEDVFRFLNAATVFQKGGKSLFNRMSHCGCRGVKCWEYTIRPYDRAYDEIGRREIYRGPADYGFLVSVYFPASDIGAIMKNLEARKSKP